MRKGTWRTGLLAGTLFIAACGLGAMPVHSADVFENWLNGADGYERAIERQGRGETVLLYFYTDWCPHCRHFDQSIAASPQMREYVSHALAVRINPDKGQREKALSERYQITGYPTLLMLTSGTGQPKNLSNARTSPEAFIAACKAVADERPVKKGGSAAKPAPAAPIKPVAAAAKAPVVSKQPLKPARNAIHLKNGNVIEGDVERSNAQEVVLDVDGLGSLVVSRAEIASIDGPLKSQ